MASSERKRNQTAIQTSPRFLTESRRSLDPVSWYLVEIVARVRDLDLQVVLQIRSSRPAAKAETDRQKQKWKKR
jgi:hypothetical protein